MTDWVAVSVDIADDPKVAAFAIALKIPLEAAVTRLLQLWGKMARHDIETGEVGSVLDDTLEAWAAWRGRRGAFATEFRRLFTNAGVVNGWWEWNGRHLRAARIERERARKRRGHGPPSSGGPSPGPSGGQSTGHTPGQLGGSTGTGTEPDLTTPPPPARTPGSRIDAALWQRLAAVLVGVREGWQVERWLDDLPTSENPTAWASNFVAWIQGLGFENGKAAPAWAIVQVCREWKTIEGRKLSALFFRRCISAVLREQQGPRSASLGSSRESSTLQNAADFARKEAS